VPEGPGDHGLERGWGLHLGLERAVNVDIACLGQQEPQLLPAHAHQIRGPDGRWRAFLTATSAASTS